MLLILRAYELWVKLKGSKLNLEICKSEWFKCNTRF